MRCEEGERYVIFHVPLQFVATVALNTRFSLFFVASAGFELQLNPGRRLFFDISPSPTPEGSISSLIFFALLLQQRAPL
jgi:hypothetical protein